MRAHLLLAALALTACSKSRTDQPRVDSASGAVASDTTRLSANTPTAAAVPVVPADAKRVAQATEYKLTDANFTAFLQANRKFSFLRARDPQLRAMIDQSASDEGMADRLEKNPQVTQVLADAGMSAKDYIVAGIAIASARRYMDDPSKAPPTPTLRENAEYLAKHKDVLAQLDSWQAVKGR